MHQRSALSDTDSIIRQEMETNEAHICSDAVVSQQEKKKG